jgi:Fe-S-cluster-containing dehydrogenase component
MKLTATAAPNACHYETPTCQKVCPIPNTILKDPAHVESEEQLWDKFVLMHHADKI